MNSFTFKFLVVFSFLTSPYHYFLCIKVQAWVASVSISVQDIESTTQLDLLLTSYAILLVQI